MAISCPPAIGTTAATVGSGSGTGTASPGSRTRLSVATPLSVVRSRRSGPVAAMDGAAGVGSTELDGLALGVGKLLVVGVRGLGLAAATVEDGAMGTVGAHPASTTAREQTRTATRATVRRPLARPRAGRGAKRPFGGVRLIGGHRLR
jgi:hypothetical protein